MLPHYHQFKNIVKLYRFNNRIWKNLLRIESRPKSILGWFFCCEEIKSMENKQSRNEYVRRIHKVQDYIESNIDSSLSIEELADIAGFSKYHFHRIFKGIVDEPLSRYVNRLKLERATHLLTYRTDMTITDIAYHFGFTDSAVFSRAFKSHYGISPSQYRNDNSKIAKTKAELLNTMSVRRFEEMLKLYQRTIYTSHT